MSLKPYRRFIRTALFGGLFVIAAGTAYYAGRKSSVTEEPSVVDSDHTLVLPDIPDSPQNLLPLEEQNAIREDDTPALIEQQIPTAETSSTGLLEKVGQVKRMLVLYPELKLPEFKLLTDEDWLDAAGAMKEDSDVAAMEAISVLRQGAAQRFIPQIRAAREEYKKQHGGVDANEPALLAKFIADPDLKQVLSRYTSSHDPQWIYVDTPPKDCWFCALTAIGREGDLVGTSRDAGQAVNKAIEEFRAKSGRPPENAKELKQYLLYPTPDDVVEKYLQND